MISANCTLASIKLFASGYEKCGVIALFTRKWQQITAWNLQLQLMKLLGYAAIHRSRASTICATIANSHCEAQWCAVIGKILVYRTHARQSHLQVSRKSCNYQHSNSAHGNRFFCRHQSMYMNSTPPTTDLEEDIVRTFYAEEVALRETKHTERTYTPVLCVHIAIHAAYF